MLNIRKSVFETNSSSMHTLCINKRNLNVPKSYTFTLEGQYGWETETCYGWETGDYFHQILIDIATTEALNRFKASDEFINNKDKYEESGLYWYLYPKKHPAYKKVIDDTINEYKLTIENILSEYGCTDVKWEEDNGQTYYIDHVDAAHDFYNQMLKDHDLLIHFLFGDSVIYTGNDNYEYDYPDYSEGCDYSYKKGN